MPGRVPDLRRMAAPRVLIPLNSGLVFTCGRRGVTRHCKVLIPLNSGLVFTLRELKKSVAEVRLNPFEFRAGIYFYRVASYVFSKSLNPFEFRAGIYL